MTRFLFFISIIFTLFATSLTATANDAATQVQTTKTTEIVVLDRSEKRQIALNCETRLAGAPYYRAMVKACVAAAEAEAEKRHLKNQKPFESADRQVSQKSNQSG